jgi:hypothetical protein
MRKIFLGMMLAMTSFAFGENKMTAADMTFSGPGDKQNLVVSITDDFDVYAYDFRIYLPEGFSILYDEDEEDYIYTMFRMGKKGGNIDIREADDGSLQIGVSNKLMEGDEGEAFQIEVTAGNDVANGTYKGELKKISLSDQNGDRSEVLENVAFNITVGGTGINNMTPDMNQQLNNSVIFNALGQRMQNAAKAGLYIVGGKKFIKK